MANNKSSFQVIWGGLLVLAGVAVFIKIPEKMSQIENIAYFSSMTAFIRFCFYLMALLLIGGGIKKMYSIYRKVQQAPENEDQVNS